MAKAWIMVVEDDLDALGALSILLELRGYDVLMALDGKAALQLLLQHRPRLIITDINMPGMDGAALCSRLKENPATADIPIIICSAVYELPAGLDKGHVIGSSKTSRL
ncbi:MAG: response regulator [Betaproteobacteria bacterium]